MIDSVSFHQNLIPGNMERALKQTLALGNEMVTLL